MGFDVALPLTVGTVAEAAQPVCDEPAAEVLVTTFRGRFRAYGASHGCLLAIEGPAPHAPDGRAVFTADELRQMVAGVSGRPTFNVTLDNVQFHHPAGSVRRVLHLPELFRRATTGSAGVALLVDVDSLIFAVEQMKKFAGPSGEVRIEFRPGDPLAIQAGPATALVLAIEAEPKTKAQPANGAAARPSAQPTRRSAKPITQTAGGCSNG
ncbi:MAG: hypothetical protein K8U57_00020 [Planctomycetes bacterium]|nr:hypothetical protein [Planctomycetota bacterium]